MSSGPTVDLAIVKTRSKRWDRVSLTLLNSRRLLENRGSDEREPEPRKLLFRDAHSLRYSIFRFREGFVLQYHELAGNAMCP